jgi:uncharacterized protein YkwD
MRSVLTFVLVFTACQPRKMETYTPPPTTPAPAPAPDPTPAATPAPAPVALPGPEILGPAFTPHGLVFPPGWNVGAMPTAMPFPMPTAFPFPTAAPTTVATAPPPPTPAPSDPSWPAANASREDAIVARVNQIRATGAICGSKAMPPVPPVTSNEMFRAAARGHSKDMATRNYFDHNNPEGKGPADRIRAAGWLNPGYSGENIAAGNPTAEGTINQWLKSAGHCENMLDKDFKLIGVGYFTSPGSKYTHYWTQNFGG